MKAVTMTVNGRSFTASVEPRTHLADFLRERLHLTGTHIGCEHGVCGACTVTIDGEISRSCITYAVQCDGAEVVTIEGFDDDPLMERLRNAFTREHALQCGYCTPGMLIAARDLVRRLGPVDESRVRMEMSGNLCRCTGYMGIIAAIRRVMAEAPDLAATPAGTKAPLGPAPGPSATSTMQRAEHVPAAGAATPLRKVTAQADIAELANISGAGLTTLRQSFIVGYPPAEVWRFFGDLRAVARCMPGAAVTEIDGDRLAGEIRVKLGPIAATFAGEGRVSRNDAERRATIIGQGRDTGSASRARGRIDYAIMDDAAGTRVEVTVGYALAGTLAQFGRSGIVAGLANRLTADFARNLQAQLAGTGGASQRDGESAALEAGGAIWAVLWSQLKQVIARLLGR